MQYPRRGCRASHGQRLCHACVVRFRITKPYDVPPIDSTEEDCEDAHLCAGKVVTGGGQRKRGLGAAGFTRTRTNTSRISRDRWLNGSGTADGGRMGKCEASIAEGLVVCSVREVCVLLLWVR